MLANLTHQRIRLATLVAALLCLALTPLFALPKPEKVLASIAPATPPDVVSVGDQQLFTIRTSIGPFSAEARAQAATERLNRLVRNAALHPGDIVTSDHPFSTDIVLGNLVLTTITDEDAAAEGIQRPSLAANDLQLIRTAITKVRGEYTYRHLLLGALYAFLVTLALITILLLFRRLFPALYAAIQRARGKSIRTIRVQSLELLTESRSAEVLTRLARFTRFVVTLLLLYFYIPLVFSFFPQTRSYGYILFGYILTPVQAGWHAFVNYLPSLLVVFVIAFFAWLALRVAHFVFREIERKTIVWSGFYPEWAMPTKKIVQLLILAFAVIVAFPYLPGSNSPAFKGVSIFLGVLFSLGSSSAVSNVVAGVLLTYTRAFRVGDRVQIADTTGDIMEKGLLATQIRTIKNVLVTIPNSIVLSSHVINFSSSSQTQPLILHVTVSIGYDAPWRQVHALLIAAATATQAILPDPPPFVLQTSLDDFYVSYQINAYTREPLHMAAIYSSLNQNIQDKFNEAGVEIMSPHYGALRDGNTTAIPADYLPPNYQPSPFRIARDKDPA
jgi:small-conductance mechanosensitive channel